MATNGYILMLEKDEHDSELSHTYFEATGIPSSFLQQSNQVLPFLNASANAFAELPALILLSMNSIPENELEVLRDIKKDIRFRHIPVIILGENTQQHLIRACYAEGASTFINKPLSNALTDASIKTFLTYWFEVAALALPQKAQHA